jgi:hypothetical protein
MHCEARYASANFSLLRGEAAVEATQRAIRARVFARFLLRGSHPIAVSAFDARIAVSRLEWAVRDHGNRTYLVAEHDGRILVAGGDWVAAAGSLDEALKALEEANENEKKNNETGDY